MIDRRYPMAETKALAEEIGPVLAAIEEAPGLGADDA